MQIMAFVSLFRGVEVRWKASFGKIIINLSYLLRKPLCFKWIDGENGGNSK